jgi:hypothetical protein
VRDGGNPTLAAPPIHSRSGLWIGLTVASALPFLLAPFPPSLDYYYWLLDGHLAGQALGRAGVADFYEIRIGPIPNLASGVGIGALSLVMPTAIAGRVFAALCAIGLSLAFAFLVRSTQGRPAAVEFLGAPWALGYVLYMGFLSYLASLALALAGVALMHRLTRSGHAIGGWTAIAMMMLGAVIFLSHIFGWVVYVIAIGVHAAFALRRASPRAALALLATLAPSIALLIWHALSSWDVSVTRLYPSLLSKSYSLLNPLSLFLRVDPFPQFAPVFWLNVLSLAAIAVVVLWNLRRGAVLDDTAPILLTGMACLALAVTLPFSWLAGLLRPDERLLLPGFLLVLAALPFKPYSLVRGAAAAGVVMTIVLVHVAEYRQASSYLAEAHAASMAHVPPGNRLLAVSVHTGNLVRNACDPATRVPSMGIPALQGFALYRSVETGDQRANIFGTGLIRPREGMEHEADVMIRVYTPEMIEAAPDLAREIRPHFPFVQVSGCAPHRDLMERALASDYAPAARGTGFVILHRVE